MVVDESVKPLIGPLDGFAAQASKAVLQQPEVAQPPELEYAGRRRLLPDVGDGLSCSSLFGLA